MAKPIKRCLIIDDDESFRQLITRYINLILPETVVEQYDPSVGGPPPLDFDWSGCDLVILDYFLNASLTGLDLLSEWKKQENFPPVIMMTAAGSEDIAVRAMKSGVQDYLRKQNITREKLRQTIEDAVNSSEQERERRLANTQSSQSFNKSLFYKKLEQPVEKGQAGTVFFLIELDQFIELGEERGIIAQDSLLRHLAKITYELFKEEKYHASMTRMSDAAIGLLFNPQPGKSVEQELKKLSTLLSGDVYEHEGELIPYTVSIGAVHMATAGNSANDILRNARAACKQVRERGGNDFAVYDPGKPRPAAAAAKPEPGRENRPAAPAPRKADKQAPAKTEYTAPAAGAPAPAVEDKPRPGTVKPAADTRKPKTAETGERKPVKETREQQSPAKSAAKTEPGKPATGPGGNKSAQTPAPEPAAVTPKQPVSEQELLEMTLELPAEQLRGTKAAAETAAEKAGGEIDILQAFGDNRMLQYYQPVMPLSDTAAESGKEYYSIRIRMVDTNGEIINADQIVADLKNARNQKLLDRWMLRQAVSRVVSYSQNNKVIPEFIIKLSEESFADANLFQWLQNKLLKRLGKIEPGKSIIIEVSAETYIARERQVEALFKFLRQHYGFRFALSSFNNVDNLNTCIDKGRFDLYKISQKLLADIQSRQSDPTAIPEQVLRLRQKGVLIVATFIEDAAMLTQAINCGADFAMGYFIGEPVDNIDEMAQIESFEIT